MRQPRRLLVIATGTALVVSAGVGTAALSARTATGTTTYPTTVRFLGGAGFQTDGIVIGELATNPKCRGLREVTMERPTSSGYTRMDKGLSSARGAWAFRYDIPASSTQFRFTATRDVRRNSNVVCEADSFVRPLGGASGRAGMAAPTTGVASGTTAYPTHIHWRYQGVGPVASDANVAGQLDTNSRCLGLRKVRMYKLTSSGYRRVDTILSSSRGAWGFLYETNNPQPDHVRFTVTEATRDNGNVTCMGSTQDERFDYG